MNLDGCTPGQRASIQRVDGPLLVSAGAGSGKTFTLTQRIAYALLPESGPAAGGIDEVLAITFTEKAASEIKARVKRTLRAEGLYAEALKVDGAWISTIHGMCARILKTHALDLGIDPAFGIVGDAERADLLAEAIDGALGADNDIVSRGSYAALFDEFKARSVMPSEPSVALMLQALLDKAVGLRGGLDAVDFGPEPARASALARDVLLAYEALLPALEQAGKSATAEKARVQAADALEALQGFLAAHGSTSSCAGDLRAFAAVLERCARVGGNFKAEVKPAVKEFQVVYDRAAQCAALGLAHPLASELMALARDVSARYEQAKRSVCKLDNDDLLTRTLQAFEERPDIAQRYESRFKLVMVDEFQDTSQLQIDMITRLAGPNCAHLCTVGDAQQSIYRFRGADVNVYEEHKRAMRSPQVDALYVELTKNFRSHADVLSFVDRVFEQPHVFGEAFMSLEANKARPTRYKGSAPRIDVVLAMQPSGRGTGVGINDVKRTCAQAVARRFAALRADGHAPGDMVVLLGKMSRADVYAEALREQGFECVVTGGSLFASAPEVQAIARFVEALANPSNTAALFEVLTGDMLRLSADDLLRIATQQDPDTGELRRRDLDRGFLRLAAQVDGLEPRLAHAVELFERSCRLTRTLPVAQVVLDAAVRSGWMARLEGQGAAGIACAANVLKAVRLIESIETERHVGLASVARAFSNELAAGLKEAPGALSGAGGNVVKIMTIHASKGLEFPIVALADFADDRVRSSKLLVETCGGVARASLAPGRSLELYPQVAKRASTVLADCLEDDADLAAARHAVQGDARAGESCSQAAYRSVLAQRTADEELAEARRKLYVGLTRASEALVVAMDAKEPASGKPFSYPALVDDIRSALCGAEDFPQGSAELSYGGSAPARFERVAVQADVAPEDASRGHSVPERFFVPAMADARALREPWRPSRGNVFSYSSIASAQGASRSSKPSQSSQDSNLARGFAGDEPLVQEPAGAVASDGDKATALGTAFHRAAQYAVETGRVPDDSRLRALAQACGLSAAQEKRFARACARWFASDVRARALAWPLQRAEAPFYVAVGQAFMEGEIDLLCTDGPEGAGSRAFVVDYKTGGDENEPADALQAKHRLQAQCYAYALLSQGYSEVELQFVRVEQDDGRGQPQTVAYAFTSADRDHLARVVLEAKG